MRLSSAAIAAFLTASSYYTSTAFQTQQPRSLHLRRTTNTNGVNHVDSNDDTSNKKFVAALQAFKLEEGQQSNMFDGPRPLVKERDACGVGFIANTNSGGEQ